MKWPEAAFPTSATDSYAANSGMTLLDWFAGQALNGLIDPENPPANVRECHDIASTAYQIAEEMMKARLKQQED